MRRRGESKLSPRPYVEAHFKTLVDTTGRRRWRDLVEQVIVPLAAGIVVYWRQVEISSATGIAMLTLAALFAAFLFQLMIQQLDKAAGWAESIPIPSRSTSAYASLLEELSANAAYSSLVSTAAAVSALAVSISSAGRAEHILAGVTVALFVHMGTTLMLVARRVFLLTVAKLKDARTGAGQNRQDSPAA